MKAQMRMHQDSHLRLHRPRCSPLSDRKSTRLNSSHRTNSYAVFCLKKKTLSSIQLETLLEVQKRLSALNGRRQMAFRVPSPYLAARFLVSDFLPTDQAQPTGSVMIR